jgi:hypothetical protein
LPNSICIDDHSRLKIHELQQTDLAAGHPVACHPVACHPVACHPVACHPVACHTRD